MYIPESMKRKNAIPKIKARIANNKWTPIQDMKIEVGLAKRLGTLVPTGVRKKWAIYNTIHNLYAPGGFVPSCNIHDDVPLGDNDLMGQCEYFLKDIAVYLVFLDGWFWLSGEEWFDFVDGVINAEGA